MSERYKTGVLGAGLGIAINILLLVIKGLAGYLANSQAMLADAFHSGADIFASAAVIVGMNVGKKPADKEHPYGHGKAETVASKIIALVIIFGGLNIGLSSLRSIYQGIDVAPGGLALWAAAISIMIKEITFRYTYFLGKKVDCKVLLANAWDHRSDVFSSLAALVGIGGARMGDWLGYSQFLYLDPLAGVVVSILIVKLGISIAGEATYELMDASANSEILEDIKEKVCFVPGVKEVHDVRARFAGPYILIDLRIGVKCELTVKEGHDITKEVKKRLMESRNDILEVIVHVNPCEIET